MTAVARRIVSVSLQASSIELGVKTLIVLPIYTSQYETVERC